MCVYVCVYVCISVMDVWMMCLRVRVRVLAVVDVVAVAVGKDGGVGKQCRIYYTVHSHLTHTPTTTHRMRGRACGVRACWFA